MKTKFCRIQKKFCLFFEGRPMIYRSREYQMLRIRTSLNLSVGLYGIKRSYIFGRIVFTSMQLSNFSFLILAIVVIV